MELLAGEDDAAVLPQVITHYELVAPLLEKQFGGSPIVYANFPGGYGQPPYYHITRVPLSARKLLWCVHRLYAIEFHTWAPREDDETRLRFARVLLERPGASVSDAGAPPFRDDQVKEAALALRATLFEANVEAIPLIDGRGGIALWIPLADAPPAVAVRAWLHVIAARAVGRHPTLLSAEPNTRDPQRVHIHVSSNARHRYSAMPYSLRGVEDLPVCTPIAWEELGEIPLVAATARTFAQRLNRCGDVFANQLARIASQALPAFSHGVVLAVSSGHTPEPRGRIITAAIAILDDGIARSADELCAEAIKRALIPETTLRKYVYSAPIEYIARSTGRGRKPPIVQDEQRRFRINEPADDWPDLIPNQEPPVDATTQELCRRLEASATGDDSVAFEIAVCDAFAHLGFLTKHLGGHKQADGVADAILGPPLEAAWRDNACVEFGYDRARREVEPYAAIVRSGRHYLLGRSRKRTKSMAALRDGSHRNADMPARNIYAHTAAAGILVDDVGWMKKPGVGHRVEVTPTPQLAQSAASRRWQSAQTVTKMQMGP